MVEFKIFVDNLRRLFTEGHSPTVLPHIPAMVALEALAYLTRCQPQKGHGYRPVKRVYLLQVGAAAGGTAGRVSGAFGKNFSYSAF